MKKKSGIKRETKVIEEPIGFHQGNVLTYLADRYGTIQQVLGELVQNQIDKQATKSRIEIDLKRRRLVSYDNGVGATIAEMRENIRNIGASKKGDKDIGGRGIGNLAPLGITGEGSKYELTTHPTTGNGSRQYFSYSMDYDRVHDQSEVFFGRAIHPVGFTLKNNKGAFDGTSTQIVVSNIVKSALRGLLELTSIEAVVELITYLSETYSGSILSKEINITVAVIDGLGEFCAEVVRAQKFPGEQLDEEIRTDSGSIRFEMYVTASKRTRPKIGVRHKGQVDFPLQNMKTLWGQVQDLLGNGHFQGVIHTDMGELNSNRSQFVHDEVTTVFEDAVLGFVVNQIKPIIDDMRQNQNARRYVSIAENVLENFAPVFEDHPELADKFKGSVPMGRPAENPEFYSITRKRRGPDRKPRKNPNRTETKSIRTGNGKSSPLDERKFSTGSLKQIMSHHGGFTLLLEEPDPAASRGTGWRVRLGETEKEEGWIIINKLHLDFKTADDGDTKLHTYLGYLISKLIAMEYMPANHAQIFSKEFEEIWLQFISYQTPRIPKGGGRKKNN